MNKKLKVLVQGTGYAGIGHTEAFRYAGAEVVGMVGRTEKVVRDVAGELQISFSGTDWAEALEVCRPDIVAIGTPGTRFFAISRISASLKDFRFSLRSPSVEL